MGLNKKQRMFLNEYLMDFNATQAAIRAGYSEKTAYSMGSRLLKNVEIEQGIQKRLDEAKMSADDVLLALAEIANASVDDVMDIESGKKVSLNFQKAKDQGKLGLIKSITPTANGIKVELHDRMRALELLGKHHKLFTDNVNLNDGKAIRVTLTDGDD